MNKEYTQDPRGTVTITGTSKYPWEVTVVVERTGGIPLDFDNKDLWAWVDYQVNYEYEQGEAFFFDATDGLGNPDRVVVYYKSAT